MSGHTLPVSDLVPLLPGAAAGAVLLALAGLLMRRHGRPTMFLAALCGALAAAAAHAITWVRLHSWPPPWPPDDTIQRGAWAVVAFCAAAMLVALLRKTSAWGRVVAFVATAGIVGLVSEVILLEERSVALGGSRNLGTGDFLIWVTAALALGALLEDAAVRRRGAALPLTLGLVMAVEALIAHAHQETTIAQLHGAAALALLAAGIFGRWLFARGFPAAAALGFSAVATVLALGLLRFSIDPPAWHLVALPWLAPILLEVGALPRIRDRKTGAIFLLRMVLVVAYLGVIVWLALDARTLR